MPCKTPEHYFNDALKQEYIKELEGYYMAKLRQTDKRPRHVFKPGDIVRYKPGRNSMPSGEGLVLKVENLSLPGNEGEPIRQRVHAIFAAKGEDLRKKARRFAKRIFYSQGLTQEVSTYENNRLEFVRECPRSWIQPISIQEIHTHRFSDLLDEED